MKKTAALLLASVLLFLGSARAMRTLQYTDDFSFGFGNDSSANVEIHEKAAGKVYVSALLLPWKKNGKPASLSIYWVGSTFKMNADKAKSLQNDAKDDALAYGRKAGYKNHVVRTPAPYKTTMYKAECYIFDIEESYIENGRESQISTRRIYFGSKGYLIKIVSIAPADLDIAIDMLGDNFLEWGHFERSTPTPKPSSDEPYSFFNHNLNGR